MTGADPVDLTGRVALITGASRGIGAAVAVACAGAGAHVVLLGRDVAGLEKTDDAVRAAGGKATLMPQDLSKLDDLETLGPILAQKFGRLDILVGNAGMLGTLTPVTHLPPKDFTRVMTLNVTANLHLLRACENLLRASDAGRAVFTTSGLARNVMAYWGAYAASKAALEILIRTFAAENMDSNLCVNLVDPGVVDTALLREAFPGGFGGKLTPVEAVARTFLQLAGPACRQRGKIIRVTEYH